MRLSRIRTLVVVSMAAMSIAAATPAFAEAGHLDPNGRSKFSVFLHDLFAILGLGVESGDVSDAGIAADPFG